MLNQPKIKKVVIVGGGTAGWMAAAVLAKNLNKSIQVTLVESDQIATVGVGEATVPPLILLNQYLGVTEKEFMTAVKGTIKLGISFENWQNVNQDYFHSFGFVGKNNWAAGFQHYWRKGLDIGIKEPLSDYCLEYQAGIAQKFSHLPNSAINYAYHLDAGYYAKFLRKIAEDNDAKRIEGKVVDVILHKDTGYIESIQLASGEIIEGDLFVDCSGFRALLIEQALHTGFDDWSHWLPCDSAWAGQIESVQEPVPYTRAIAHTAGWQWRIPLQHRVGCGMVYCSRYMSDDEARKFFLDSVESKPIVEPHLIKFKAGQRLKYWNKNCIALGLASGFIEPLESTSIHMIQKGITRLVQLFPLDGIKKCDVDEYNSQMKFEIENIRDFVAMHYHVTQREDSKFWRYCKNMPIPESLAHRLKLFKESGQIFIKSGELFAQASWLQVMTGQGLLPEHYNAVVNQMSNEELTDFLRGIREPLKKTLAQLPSHQEYLDYYCKATNWD